MSATTNLKTCVVIPQELADFLDCLKQCRKALEDPDASEVQFPRLYALAAIAFQHALVEDGELVYVIFPATIIGINSQRREELESVLAGIKPLQLAPKEAR
jgi:hypothetical protein